MGIFLTLLILLYIVRHFKKSEFLIIPIDDFEKIMAKDFQLTKKVIMN